MTLRDKDRMHVHPAIQISILFTADQEVNMPKNENPLHLSLYKKS